MGYLVAFACLFVMACAVVSVGISYTDWEWWAISLSAGLLWALPGVEG